MIIKLPKEPICKLYNLQQKDHLEFNESNLLGEPILDIMVLRPKIHSNMYVYKNGYTYLWERRDISEKDYCYTLWLIYPENKRPIEIEIEDYEEGKIKKYDEYCKEYFKKYEEPLFPKKNIIKCDKKIDLDVLSNTLVDYISSKSNKNTKEKILEGLNDYFNNLE